MKGKKTTTVDIDWQELIHLEITAEQNALEKVQTVRDNLLIYGVDAAGVLTKMSQVRVNILEKKESLIQSRLYELRLQLELQSHKKSIPTRDAETEVDEWTIVENYQRDSEKEKALKEIQQLRERSSDKENEIER